MLSDNLRQLRQENNLNQKDFADMFGISTVSLSSYENGTKMPPLELLINISQKFNISLDELCDNKNSVYITIPDIIDFLYQLVLDDIIYLRERFETINDTYTIFGAFFKYKVLDDFLQEFNDMVHLYNGGTIKKSLLDLWIIDKKLQYREKYKNDKNINMTKEEYLKKIEEENMKEVINSQTKIEKIDDTLPF